MEKKTFLKGAAILGIAGLLVQIMGAVFRIPLGNIIGDDGMGYYQTAYPIYVFLLVFSTNGAPAAISKMTSERIALGRYSEAYRVFRCSFILMFALGIVAFAAVFFGAGMIVEAVSNPGAYYAMRAIAPALLIVPLMAVYRGYFQGMQDMGPTAVSQLAEQAVRVAVGLTLSVVLLKNGLEAAAAGATAGTSIGPVVGLIVLFIIYARRKKQLFAQMEEENSRAGAAENTVENAIPFEKEKASDIIKTLAYIGIPITIGVSIMPIMNLADLLFVMRRLRDIGFSEQQANALYGQLTGMALPVVNIPMALALSMALAMVPAIAAAKSTGDNAFLGTNIRLGMRTSMIIGVPCSFGLMSLAEPVMRLLYPLEEESAVSSAQCLFIVSAGIIFLCIAQTMAGVLQGVGRPGTAVYGLIAGFAVKCAGNYILTAIPALNINGAAWASVLGFVTIGLFNMIAVKKITGVRYDIKLSVVKPVACGALMYAVVVIVYRLLSAVCGNSISTVLSIGTGACIYGITLLKLHAIEPHEIEALPKGKKLAVLLKKLKLI
ncbi:MAG: polysaccharide biosynthesis protein [Clostridia bacterium]|nr:polysaccharide biosynthesis protein [Clostridia bacterium]